MRARRGIYGGVYVIQTDEKSDREREPFPYTPFFFPFLHDEKCRDEYMKEHVRREVDGVAERCIDART